MESLKLRNKEDGVQVNTLLRVNLISYSFIHFLLFSLWRVKLSWSWRVGKEEGEEGENGESEREKIMSFTFYLCENESVIPGSKKSKKATTGEQSVVTFSIAHSCLLIAQHRLGMG